MQGGCIVSGGVVLQPDCRDLKMPMDFAEWFSARMEARSLTRPELLRRLEAAGKPRGNTTISYWIGKGSPDPEILPVLLAALEVDDPLEICRVYALCGIPLPTQIIRAAAAALDVDNSASEGAVGASFSEDVSL